jgi:hypothetical protein
MFLVCQWRLESDDQVTMCLRRVRWDSGRTCVRSGRGMCNGKTLDFRFVLDFTFGDEMMTYMHARGPWFDTRKPHKVGNSCSVANLGALYGRGKTTPMSRWLPRAGQSRRQLQL